MLGRQDPLSCDICGTFPADSPTMRPMGPLQGGTGQPKTLWIDVFESLEHYVLVADVPGVKKEEVSVTLEDDNVLKIKIDRLFPQNERVLRQERDFGRFLRWLRLPRSVDTGKMSARVDNGQLVITIPKTGVHERGQLQQAQHLQITSSSSSEQQQQQQQGPKLGAVGAGVGAGGGVPQPQQPMMHTQQPQQQQQQPHQQQQQSQLGGREISIK